VSVTAPTGIIVLGQTTPIGSAKVQVVIDDGSIFPTQLFEVRPLVGSGSLVVFDNTGGGYRVLATNLSWSSTYGGNSAITLPLVGAGPFNDVTLDGALVHISSTLASTISGWDLLSSTVPWPNFPIVHFVNVGTVNIDLLHESVLSAPANRMRLVGGASETIPPGGGWFMTPAPVPSLGDSRWHLLGVNQ
jgi:hypothetical protein